MVKVAMASARHQYAIGQFVLVHETHNGTFDAGRLVSRLESDFNIKAMVYQMAKLEHNSK